MLEDISIEQGFSAPPRDPKRSDPPSYSKFLRVLFSTFILGLLCLLGFKFFNFIATVIWPNNPDEKSKAITTIISSPSNTSSIPIPNPNAIPTVQDLKTEDVKTQSALHESIQPSPAVQRQDTQAPVTQGIKESKEASSPTKNTPPIPAKEMSKTKKNPASTPLSAMEERLLKYPSQHYALQIMATHDVKKLNTTLLNEHLSKKALYYRTTHQGKPWYVAVYGDFETFEQAKKAMKELPKTIQDCKPWPKRYKNIKAAIRER